MSHPAIIAVYGFPGAGKSTIVNVGEHFGIPTVSMGDIVRSRAHDELGDNLSSEEIAEWATNERERHHDAIIATYTAEHIKTLDHNTVIVDGVRSLPELDEFDVFDTYTIHVTATFGDRLERLQDRGRANEGSFDASDLANRDQGEIQWGLGDLVDEHAPDHTIHNDRSFDWFRRTAARTVFDIASETGAFESVPLDDPSSEGVRDVSVFLESEPWSIRPTNTVPHDNDPTNPYIEIHCPRCESPNVFGEKITSLSSPITCASCGEDFEIRMSINPV